MLSDKQRPHYKGIIFKTTVLIVGTYRGLVGRYNLDYMLYVFLCRTMSFDTMKIKLTVYVRAPCDLSWRNAQK